jgi:hypothetical protein
VSLPLYARPAIVRGQQCAEARLGRRRATEQLPGRAVGGRAPAGASPPSRHGCRAPQAPSTEHGSASRRAAARRGSPALPGHPVRVLGQRPPVRRPVSSVNVQCPRVRCPREVSSVRCGVQRPVSGVGVRYSCVPASAVSERVRVVERGGGAGSRTAGVRVVARGVHDRCDGCQSRSLALEAGAGRAGSVEASAWTWPSSWGGALGSGQVDRVAEDRPSVGSRGAQRGSPSCGRPRARQVTPPPCCSEPAEDRAPAADVELGVGSRHKGSKGAKRGLSSDGGGDHAPWSPHEA